jgi:hypothetical protein
MTGSTLGRALAGVLALTILATGCALHGGESPVPGTPLPHPVGEGLVLRVWTAGGFVAPDYRFGQPPDFTLTGDGRVIELGAVAAIYPGPALPPLLVRRLSEEGVQRLIAEAVTTGWFDRSRAFTGAARFIADAPTTTFTLQASGRRVTVSVYALGIAPGSGTSAPPPDEAAAASALQALARRLADLSWLPASDWIDAASRPFEPTALRLLVQDADAEQPDPSGIAPTEVAWPTSTDPASFGGTAELAAGRCGVVTGTDAATWLAALRAATSLTRFVSGGHRYRVIARPLLPDEPRTCSVPAA